MEWMLGKFYLSRGYSTDYMDWDREEGGEVASELAASLGEPRLKNMKEIQNSLKLGNPGSFIVDGQDYYLFMSEGFAEGYTQERINLSDKESFQVKKLYDLLKEDRAYRDRIVNLYVETKENHLSDDQICVQVNAGWEYEKLEKATNRDGGGADRAERDLMFFVTNCRKKWRKQEYTTWLNGLKEPEKFLSDKSGNTEFLDTIRSLLLKGVSWKEFWPDAKNSKKTKSGYVYFKK